MTGSLGVVSSIVNGLTDIACWDQAPTPGNAARRADARMGGPEKILDPTGEDAAAADTTLAPRPVSLRGLTVGLLENGKPNSSAVLAAVGRELERRQGLKTSVMFRKSYFGTPAEQSLIQQILHNCDFAVAGIGD
jgi:hypothetical protein